MPRILDVRKSLADTLRIIQAAEDRLAKTIASIVKLRVGLDSPYDDIREEFGKTISFLTDRAIEQSYCVNELREDFQEGFPHVSRLYHAWRKNFATLRHTNKSAHLDIMTFMYKHRLLSNKTTQAVILHGKKGGDYDVLHRFFTHLAGRGILNQKAVILTCALSPNQTDYLFCLLDANRKVALSAERYYILCQHPWIIEDILLKKLYSLETWLRTSTRFGALENIYDITITPPSEEGDPADSDSASKGPADEGQVYTCGI